MMMMMLAALALSPPTTSVAHLQSLEALVAAREESQIAALIRDYRCHSVYLDVGTSVGTQIRKLYEPLLFPGAKVLPLFNQIFGRGSRCGVCAIGFEPNPRHAWRLDKLEANLRSRGAGVLVFRAAAGGSDGTTSFLINAIHQDSVAWSQGAHVDSLAGARRRHKESLASVPVRRIDLARIVHTLHAQLRGKGRVAMMKLDVEGNEYEVMEHLVHARALCLVGLATVEWHPARHDYEWQGGASSKLISLAQDDFRTALRGAAEALARTPSCNSSIIALDDEMYGDTRGANKSFGVKPVCPALAGTNE